MRKTLPAIALLAAIAGLTGPASAQPQSAPPQSAPPQTAPPQTAPPQTALPQSALPQSAPARSALPQSDRLQSTPPVSAAQSAPPPEQPAPVATQTGTATPRVNDFPTQARVQYVLACADENAGDRPPEEMLLKCVCAVDAIAARVNYDRWTELSTINLARQIGGERGSYIRERMDLPGLQKAYRELQAAAYKSCFITPPENG